MEEWRRQSQQLHGPAHQMAHKTVQLLMILWCKEKWQQEEGRHTFIYVIGFYQQLKSFWSCSHMNCCLQNILHINLHIFYIVQVKTS